jgi:pyruvate ferredoxin oxidoreductase delta subunit
VAKNDYEMTWKDFNVGCIVTEPGSASQYKTGDWRSQRPIWDKTKCIKCGICYLFCPEPCIGQDPEGYFEANLYYCKGCGMCSKECPTSAIRMIEEVS